MSVVVAYKWTYNPQDAVVGHDGVVDWSRAKAAMSEYDPVAVALGRRAADAQACELVGISVGPAATGAPIATKGALSRGIDRALLVADDVVGDWNPAQVAAALAGLVARVPQADLLLTGEASVDEGSKMMPALVAGHLGWPCFQDVLSVTRDGAGYTVTTAVPGGTRTIGIDGPVVVAVAGDALVPPVPGMKDILAAARKPVGRVPAADLAVADLGVKTTGRARPAPLARKHQMFQGEPAEAANRLAAALRADGVL
jgi:electron transfer flavoprotein beta subunit